MLNRVFPAVRRTLTLLCAGIVSWMAVSAPNAVALELQVVTESLPPLNYEDKGKVTGFSTELLQSVLHTAGLDAEIQLIPWARAYQTALTQPNTLIYSITRTPERDALFEWIGPISPRQIFLYKLRRRHDVQVSSLADAASYKTGLVREMASTKDFINVSGFAAAAFDFAPTVESNMKKLFMDRIDLLVSLDWSAAYLAKALEHSPSELEPVVLLDKSRSYYFALNKQSDPALLSRLRLAFEKVQQSGQIEQLKTKYMR